MGQPRGNRIRLALVLLLSLTTLLEAQAAPPQEAFEPEPDRPARILLEGGGGVLGALAGGLAGGLLGLGALKLVQSETHDDKTTGAYLFLGGAAGAYLGLGIGVWAVGHWQGANGSWTAMAMGELTGLLVGWTLLRVSGSGHKPDFADQTWSSGLSLLLTVGLPLAGAIVGYEVTTYPVQALPQSTGQGLSPAISWMPLLLRGTF